MASEHKFIDHTADIAVDITADSFEELIQESLKAYNNSVFEKTDEQANDEVIIRLAEQSREELIVSFLNEINYMLTVKKWISKSIYDLLIDYENGSFILDIKLRGCLLTNDVQLKEEIKSVTYHQMEIKEERGKLITRIVFDI